MIRHSIHIHCVLLLVLATLSLLHAAGCSQEAPPASQERQSRSVPVTTTEVRVVAFEQTLRGIGSLEAANQVVIQPERPGIVEEVHFQEGRAVAQGDMLFTLRDDKLQQELEERLSALRSARATLERARRRFERFASLFDQDTISREELEQVETEYETAAAEVSRHEAQAGLVREQLADTMIRAPAGGTLSESLVDPGDYVEEGDDLATLYDRTAMEIAFTVSGNRMPLLQEGQSVRIMVDAYPESIFSGRVTFIDPAVDSASRTLLIKARLDNSGHALKPGLFAAAEVVVDRRTSPAVPEQALVAVRTGYVVFTVEPDRTVSRQPVEIGLRQPGLAEITQGLATGDLVVTQGQMNLTDGTRVTLESESRPAPGQENDTSRKPGA